MYALQTHAIHRSLPGRKATQDHSLRDMWGIKRRHPRNRGAFSPQNEHPHIALTSWTWLAQDGILPCSRRIILTNEDGAQLHYTGYADCFSSRRIVYVSSPNRRGAQSEGVPSQTEGSPRRGC